MKYIAIFLCIVGLAMAQGYTDWQQGAADSLKIGFKMGQAYEQAQNGINVSGFNAQVDVYNAWVREHFGEDPMMLMQKKLDAPVDLSKPVLIANNTTGGGIVHAIDGTGKAKGANYTTNDMNLLPNSVTDKMYKDSQKLDPNSAAYLATQGNYLGGV
jgi:hypothetical protein